MTETMVERVARAICWSNGMNPDLTLGGDGQNFLWHEYVPQARAAIDAMKWPSPKMIDAGTTRIYVRPKMPATFIAETIDDTQPIPSYRSISPDDFEHRFRMAIDAALSETEGG